MSRHVSISEIIWQGGSTLLNLRFPKKITPNGHFSGLFHNLNISNFLADSDFRNACTKCTLNVLLMTMATPTLFWGMSGLPEYSRVNNFPKHLTIVLALSSSRMFSIVLVSQFYFLVI